MSGEHIARELSVINATTSGASLADTVFSTVADVNQGYVALTEGLAAGDSHTLADLVFKGTFAAAPVSGQSINVYRRDMNINVTDDAPAPSAAYTNIFIASIILSTDITQTLSHPAVPISKDCTFYIENDSGQTLNSGWLLTVIPKGFGVAA